MAIVKQNAEKEVPAEVLASSIAAISDGMKKLRGSRLSERALLILLQDASRVPMRDIKSVLEGLDSLGRLYLKKTP